MSAPETIIRVRQVTKHYATPTGPFTVLDGISFDVNRGEVIGILGPSGSGKSTLLRTLNALETIADGDIEVAGINYRTTDLKPYEFRRQTAMIFQRFELFPHMTCLENVMAAPRFVLRKSEAESREIAENLLSQVGLIAQKDKYPSKISGGQQQRVAIARALAIGPKVLLCDEPTSALDPELVKEVLDILAAIAAKGMTMLIVTHEVRFAEAIAHRCLFLDRGQLLEDAPTGDFFGRPRSPRLGDFLSRIK
jgi:ABC-type polar amino acid transport system ATPase subunit